MNAFKAILFKEVLSAFPDEEIQLPVAFKFELEASLKLESTTTGLFREKSDQKVIILKILSPHLKELAVKSAASLPMDLIASWKTKDISVSNINGLALASAHAQKIANGAAPQLNLIANQVGHPARLVSETRGECGSQMGADFRHRDQQRTRVAGSGVGLGPFRMSREAYSEFPKSPYWPPGLEAFESSAAQECLQSAV